MSVVVPLEHDDPHVAVQALLPWFARGQLDADEMSEVQAHLQTCAACRAEYEAERPLQTLMSLPATAPLGGDVEAGLAKMRARINKAEDPARKAQRPARWMAWALGAQGCAIAALLALLVLPHLGEQEQPAYKGLSSPQQSTAAEALIMFRPDASDQRIREVLQAHGAQIVGGPTESGAYRLHLDGGVQALPGLRNEAIVTLAESLGPGAAR